jgi:hypothetical protein
MKIKLNVLFVLALSAAFIVCGCGKKGDINAGRMAYYDDLRNALFNVSMKDAGLKKAKNGIQVYGVIVEQNVADMMVMTYAAFANGDGVQILRNGNCFISYGEGGNEDGVAKKLYGIVQKYMKRYERDVQKYWKDKTFDEAAQGMLFTSFIGEEGRKTVAKSAKVCIETARQFNEGFVKDAGTSLTPANTIKVHILTDGGKFSVQGTPEQVNNSTVPLLRMMNFFMGDIMNNAPAEAFAKRDMTVPAAAQ